LLCFKSSLTLSFSEIFSEGVAMLKDFTAIFSRKRRMSSFIVLLALLIAAQSCTVADNKPTSKSSAEGSQSASLPHGKPLSKSEIVALGSLFNENPLTGGQTPPRAHKWVNENVSMFLQFDRPEPAEAKALRYIGIAVKGVFCSETQPDKAFTHFHQYNAPKYSEGHGRNPGDQGYWLLWVATDEFDLRERKIKPGIDYEAFPTPPPSCGANVPKVNFSPQAADKLTREEITKLASLFNDNPLTGGQVAPRAHKWVNENVSIFLQFDNASPAEATALRYIGIGVNGEFCKSKQPHPDFPHFHKFNAATYSEGHGRTAGDKGIWLLWVATDEFDLRGRKVTAGVDREFAPLKIPDC
jgi:hypothetical protein